MTVLTTERLRLEPWAAAHTELLVALSAMPAIVRHVGDGSVWSRERAEDRSRRQREHWAAHGYGWRAVVERATEAPVGLIAHNLAGEGTAGLAADEHEIGWWIHPDRWRRGYAREGAAAVRDDAFERVGAPSVVARIQPGNAASVAVATALGLTREFGSVDKAGVPLTVYRLT